MLKYAQILSDIDDLGSVPKWLKNPLKDFEKIPSEFDDCQIRMNDTEQQKFVFISYTMALHQCYKDFDLNYSNVNDGLIKTIYITAKSICNDYSRVKSDMIELHKANKRAERLVNVIERNIDVNCEKINYGISFLDALNLSINAKIKE